MTKLAIISIILCFNYSEVFFRLFFSGKNIKEPVMDLISKKLILFILLIILISNSCSTKRSVRYSKGPISSNSSIAVIIDCPNNVKNVILAEFMKRRFKVKAFNASDLYIMSDVYDIKDFKRRTFLQILSIKRWKIFHLI